jgi:hypothetical protein
VSADTRWPSTSQHTTPPATGCVRAVTEINCPQCCSCPPFNATVRSVALHRQCDPAASSIRMCAKITFNRAFCCNGLFHVAPAMVLASPQFSEGPVSSNARLGGHAVQLGTWLTLVRGQGRHFPEISSGGRRCLAGDRSCFTVDGLHFAGLFEWAVDDDRLCTRYGISRNTGYQWRASGCWPKRHGLRGMNCRAPLSSLNATPQATIDLILASTRGNGWGAHPGTAPRRAAPGGRVARPAIYRGYPRAERPRQPPLAHALEAPWRAACCRRPRRTKCGPSTSKASLHP